METRKLSLVETMKKKVAAADLLLWAMTNIEMPCEWWKSPLCGGYGPKGCGHNIVRVAPCGPGSSIYAYLFCVKCGATRGAVSIWKVTEVYNAHSEAFRRPGYVKYGEKEHQLLKEPAVVQTK